MAFYLMEMLLKHISHVCDWGLSDATMGSDDKVVPSWYSRRLPVLSLGSQDLHSVKTCFMYYLSPLFLVLSPKLSLLMLF